MLVVPTSRSVAPLTPMMSGMRKLPPISMSCPRETTTSFPAAIDQTAPNNGRSWVASTAGGSPPVPPVIPSTGLFGTIDSFGLPGDWLIRAAGTVVPVELMNFSID